VPLYPSYLRIIASGDRQLFPLAGVFPQLECLGEDQRAIELDPNFATGYWAVGIDYFGLGELGRASEYS
jgi:hypothetical protein